MHLARLHIAGFRNLVGTELALSPGFNYLYGANGAGKTAILEAVHVLARGRSFRANTIDRLVNHQSKDLLLRAEVTNRRGTHRLGFTRQGGSNEFSVDGIRGKGFAGLAEQLAVQTLLPNSADLVYGAPSERRRFLDWGLFHVEQTFLAVSRQYARALQQRNAWLKTQEDSGLVSLDPWMESVYELGLKINRSREQYVGQLQAPFLDALSALSSALDVHLDYEWGGLVNEAESHKKMSESFARDVKFGSTHRGPHRADLIMQMSVDPTESNETHSKAQEVLSRGQAKVVASALMLAQVELQRRLTGEGSVVLIDDLGAELDADHWQRFVVTLENLGCQVIATSTELPDKQRWLDRVACDVFHVEQGEVHPL